ncbi:hypothetical protein V2I08_01230 [Sphingobium sp. MK2]
MNSRFLALLAYHPAHLTDQHLADVVENRRWPVRLRIAQRRSARQAKVEMIQSARMRSQSLLDLAQRVEARKLREQHRAQMPHAGPCFRTRPHTAVLIMSRDKAIEHPPIKRFQKLRKRASHMRNGRSPKSCLDTMILADSAGRRCRAIYPRKNIPDSCGIKSGIH